jgi:hypothetical protein
MSKYDEVKANHADCKQEMSSSQWQKFAVKGIIKKCPVCGKGAFEASK